MKHEKPQLESDIAARTNGDSAEPSEIQCLQKEARVLRGAIGRSLRDLKDASQRAADPRYWFRHHPVASTVVAVGAAAWIGLRVYQTARGDQPEARDHQRGGLGRTAESLFSSASKAAKSALISAVVARFVAEPDNEAVVSEEVSI